MHHGTKFFPHKGCSCFMCRHCPNQWERRYNERKLRRRTKEDIRKYLLGIIEDVEHKPITSPYLA